MKFQNNGKGDALIDDWTMPSSITPKATNLTTAPDSDELVPVTGTLADMSIGTDSSPDEQSLGTASIVESAPDNLLLATQMAVSDDTVSEETTRTHSKSLLDTSLDEVIYHFAWQSL